MDKKIEELVEWVAIRIKGNDRVLINSFVDNNESVQMELCKLIARSILSHPNLAWIDKAILTNPHTSISEILDAVIPLAKEVKDDY